jgi:hypothetical protein
VEALYSQGRIQGRAVNLNEPNRTTSTDDIFMTRLRVQRDF